MTDRNVEAQPGDKTKTELDGQTPGSQSVPTYDGLSCPDCGFPRAPGAPYCENCGVAFAEAFADAPHLLAMPHKADVSADQATRVGPSRAAARSPRKALSLGSRLGRRGETPTKAGPGTKAGPDVSDGVAGVAAHQARAPKAATALDRPTPHPLSKGRRPATERIAATDTAARLARSLAANARPSRRGIFGIAGITATVAIVSALLVALPNLPGTTTASGSVYSINWTGPVTLPVTSLDFGPYFVSLDGTLLMVGTVNTTTTVGSSTFVSSTTTVWASTDGTTWTQRSHPGSFGMDGRRFVAQGISDDGQGGLVVIGNSLGAAPTDVAATAWHSKDGGQWTQMQVDSGGGQEMAAGVASGNGVAVAAGNGVAWLCDDGQTWTPEALPGMTAEGGSYTPSVVTSWDGGFAIVGLWIGSGPTRSAVWYSYDGRNWAQARTQMTGFLAAGAASIGGRAVLVGSDLGDASPGLAASWSSSDGNVWTESTAPTDLSTVALDGVAGVGNSLVAFGSPAGAAAAAAAAAASTASPGPTVPGTTPRPVSTELFWVSDDGVNWLPLTSGAAPFDHGRMAAVGDHVIMVGGFGKTLTALGGTATFGKARPVITPAAEAKFALNVKAGAVPMIPDVVKGYTLSAVTTSSDRFYTFATGPAGTSIFTSGDGGLWVQELKPTGLTKLSTTGQNVVTGRPVVLQAVPDGKGGILAIGKITNTDGDNGMIWHMTKPGTWKQVNFEDDTPTEFSSIAVGPNGYVAASDTLGGSQIMYSTDGDNWQAGTIAVGGGLPLYVATYHYGFVAVGVDATKGGATSAWTSPDGRTWTLRTDWHLPANVTAIAAMGYGLVATAETAIPGLANASPTPSPTPVPLATPAGTARPASSPTAKPTATPKPTPTPRPTPVPTLPPNLKPITWWWSGNGVAWSQSGLTSSVGNWSIVDNEILVLDAPASLSSDWTLWSSGDGRTWKHPSSASITFAGSKTCLLAYRGSSVLIVGWQSSATLKGFYGSVDVGG